jgi:glucose 1-dehydrogenase
MSNDQYTGQDPQQQYRQPDSEGEQVDHPGLTGEMGEQPDHGEESYRGSGRLQGKKAVVTGGDSGIGRAVALAFAREGADVLIVYLEAEEKDAQETVSLVEDAGRRAVTVPADLTEEEQCQRVVDRAVQEFGGIDVLVNNAGIQIPRPSHELSQADFERVLAVNLRGAFLCAREAIKRFLGSDTPGSIINVSSVHQLIPKPNYLGYSVSKGGMQNLTRTLALEYADHGIRVNGIGPGATITPINRAWVDDPAKAEMVTSHIPLARAGTADEMGGVACFLASDDGAYITGQTIFVDGGLTLFADFREPWSSE